MKVPSKLQASLPYASKFKLVKAQNRPTYLQKRTVALDAKEKEAVALLQQIRALRKDQVARRQQKKDEWRASRKKKLEKEESKKANKEKEKKKGYMRLAGIKDKRDTDMEEGRTRKRRKV